MTNDSLTLPEIVEIVTTFENEKQAQEVAGELVNQRLVACGQVDGPTTSIYQWNDAVNTGIEYRCSLKTLAAILPQTLAKLNELHPYEVPQIIVRKVSSSQEYYDWVTKCVKQ